MGRLENVGSLDRKSRDGGRRRRRHRRMRDVEASDRFTMAGKRDQYVMFDTRLGLGKPKRRVE
jgi:hypothetical protein